MQPPFLKKDVQQLPSLMTDHADYRKMLFGVKTVSICCVNAFFFQLVASKICAFEMDKKSEVTIVLAKDDNGPSLHKKCEVLGWFSISKS